MLRKAILMLGSAICLLFISSCDKNSDNAANNKILFAGTMNGANEVPAVVATGAGTVAGSFDVTTKILTVTITYSGLSSAITAWHLHKAAAGVKGSPVAGLDFGTMGTSPFTWSSVALDATMEADLMNNLWYANIHTANNGGGEIRGQLTKQ
jgi:hypothetical protein